MPRLEVPAGDRWRIVGFLRSKRRDTTGVRPETQPIAGRRLEVSAAALLNARADSGNWLMYSGAYDSHRYSRLAQIDRRNISRLRLLWLYQTGGSDPRYETSPLAVDGILYLTTSTNGVRALDGETGALL